MSLTAADMMTGDLKVAEATWSVGELTEFLAAHCISGAPVVDEDGQLIGVVSLTDIARAAAGGPRKRHGSRAHDFYVYGPALAYGVKARPRAEAGLTVRAIMTPHVFDVPANATAKEIAEVMLRHRIHRVFVTESGMVIGVISAFDMLRAVL